MNLTEFSDIIKKQLRYTFRSVEAVKRKNELFRLGYSPVRVVRILIQEGY